MHAGYNAQLAKFYEAVKKLAQARTAYRAGEIAGAGLLAARAEYNRELAALDVAEKTLKEVIE